MIWEAQIWIPKETVLMSCQSETETCLTLLTDILLKQSTVHIYTLFIKQYQTYKIATGSLHKQEKGNYKSKFRNFKARKKYQKIRQCRRINYIIIYSLVYLFYLNRTDHNIFIQKNWMRQNVHVYLRFLLSENSSWISEKKKERKKWKKVKRTFETIT